MRITSARAPALRVPRLLLVLPALALGRIDVDVQGNAHFRSRALKEALPPDPEAFTEDDLAAWREDALFNLEDLYRREGYFDAQVEVALQRKENGGPEDFLAAASVREGDRYAFGEVRVLVEGDAGMAVDQGDLKAVTGKPFRETLLLQDRRHLLRTFGNAGFVRAQADYRVAMRPVDRAVDVEYRVDPAYPVVFDTLVIRNLRAPPADTAPGITREGLLRSLVPYVRGDTVRMSGNDRIIEKLQYAGAYNFVRFKDSLREEGGSVLTLFVEERVPGYVRTGIFYETQYGPGASVDLRHGNLAGTLNEARGGASVAGRRQAGYLGYGSPLTFGRLVRFDDDLDLSWVQDNENLHDTVGLFAGNFHAANSARLTWPWSYWLSTVANAELEAKSRMIDSATRERGLNLNFIGTASLSFVNQAMDPTRGLRLALSLGNGGPLVKYGEFQIAKFRHNWVEARTSQYYYYPPLRQVRWASRLDGGSFFGEGGSNSERFFLGGSRSVRSYDYRDLCPEKSADGVCVGEDLSLAYFLASLELRLQLFDFGFIDPRGFLRALIPLQVAPFVDYGKVWDQDAAFRLTTPGGGMPAGQGYSLGLGLRYPLLGIFNLRVDILGGSGPKWFWIDLAQAF